MKCYECKAKSNCNDYELSGGCVDERDKMTVCDICPWSDICVENGPTDPRIIFCSKKGE